MVDLKLVLSTKDGKSYQKEIKSPESDVLHGKRIGETISGDQFGFTGYEFTITGGSDKCGFPMRKGVQQHRKRIMASGSVGFSGKGRNKKKQKGLLKRFTVCGERITAIIRQVNIKVVKEGPQPLGEVPAKESVPEIKETSVEKSVSEVKAEEEKKEAQSEKKKEEVVQGETN